MNFRSGISLMAVLLLSACGGSSPFTAAGDAADGATEDAVDPAIVVVADFPAALSKNLASADFSATDPANPTLTISLSGFDAAGEVNAMNRDAAFDMVSADGSTVYRAFTSQSNANRRRYLALFGASANTVAGVTATEVANANQYGGGSYARLEDEDLPTSGEADYVGKYAGVLTVEPTPANLDTNGDGIDDFTEAAVTRVDNDRASRVTGDIQMFVNFNDSVTQGAFIEGNVKNRMVETLSLDGTGQESISFPTYDATAATAMLDLNLSRTEVSIDTGIFEGNVIIGGTTKGTFGGVIAGVDASEIAGVVVFNPFTNAEIFEYGVFVLPECTTAAASSNCAPPL